MPRTRIQILAPRFPHGNYPPIRHVRSTLLTASLQGIRQLGWEQRYFDALPAELHDTLRTLIAGTWCPFELGIAHYTACDAMGLSKRETEAMGASVSARTQRTFVGTLGSIAAGAGATPFHVYRNGHRIWARIFDGGDHEAYEVGPKDVDIICRGCPLLRLKYFRTSMGSYYAALAGMVARSVHWRELEEHRTDRNIGLRVSWV